MELGPEKQQTMMFDALNALADMHSGDIPFPRKISFPTCSVSCFGCCVSTVLVEIALLITVCPSSLLAWRLDTTMAPWLAVGVFHRDLTLGNVMGNVDCTFKVIDLGMSGPSMPNFVHEEEADRRFSHRCAMP